MRDRKHLAGQLRRNLTCLPTATLTGPAGPEMPIVGVSTLLTEKHLMYYEILKDGDRATIVLRPEAKRVLFGRCVKIQPIGTNPNAYAIFAYQDGAGIPQIVAAAVNGYGFGGLHWPPGPVTDWQQPVDRNGQPLATVYWRGPVNLRLGENVAEWLKAVGRGADQSNEALILYAAITLAEDYWPAGFTDAVKAALM